MGWKRLTRQQRLGLLVGALTAALIALAIILTPRRQGEVQRIYPPAVEEPIPDGLKQKASKKKKQADRPAPTPRNPLDEEF